MELEYPQWQKPYVEALLELDPIKLRDRISIAEAHIRQRCNELDGSDSQITERLCLDDALDGLRSLKRTKFYYSNWEDGWPRPS